VELKQSNLKGDKDAISYWKEKKEKKENEKR
jgi:hypothetical protein